MNKVVIIGTPQSGYNFLYKKIKNITQFKKNNVPVRILDITNRFLPIDDLDNTQLRTLYRNENFIDFFHLTKNLKKKLSPTLDLDKDGFIIESTASFQPMITEKKKVYEVNRRIKLLKNTTKSFVTCLDIESENSVSWIDEKFDTVVFFRENILAELMTRILHREGSPRVIAKGEVIEALEKRKILIDYIAKLNPSVVISLETMVSTGWFNEFDLDTYNHDDMKYRDWIFDIDVFREMYQKSRFRIEEKGFDILKTFFINNSI